MDDLLTMLPFGGVGLALLFTWLRTRGIPAPVITPVPPKPADPTPPSPTTWKVREIVTLGEPSVGPDGQVTGYKPERVKVCVPAD